MVSRSSLYVGFVIDGRVPSFSSCTKHRNPFHLISGWQSHTAVATMRFGWIAEAVNGWQGDVRYELYRPWRKYYAVVFLKSMGAESIALRRSLEKSGVRTFFDANVDYFTPASGTFYYQGMAPKDEQRQDAMIMAQECDGVICDSTHITEVASQHLNPVVTVEDNIREVLIAAASSWEPGPNGELVLLWSGQAIKLFDLLVIKDALLAFRKSIHLKIITNSLEVLTRWYPGYKDEFVDLLGQISHEIIPFCDIQHLMRVYDQGGVFISPRFLDNSYNLGHTEWKITLAMARGRVVVCSPQQSYLNVQELTGGLGVRACHDSDGWCTTFEQLLTGSFDWRAEQAAAIDVVRRHYSSDQIAKKLNAFIMQ